jgi:uncharacterized protein
MPNVVHFEICADEPEQVVAFYSKVFDWKIEKESGVEYWAITTGADDEPGITGAIMRRFDPLNSTINTIDVPSLDVFARKITEAGGKVLAPKVAIAGLGYVQYCADVEGNGFALLEYHESAK